MAPAALGPSGSLSWCRLVAAPRHGPGASGSPAGSGVSWRDPASRSLCPPPRPCTGQVVSGWRVTWWLPLKPALPPSFRFAGTESPEWARVCAVRWGRRGDGWRPCHRAGRHFPAGRWHGGPRLLQGPGQPGACTPQPRAMGVRWGCPWGPPGKALAPESPPSPPRLAMSSEPPPPPQPPTHQTSVGLLDTQQSRDRSPSPLRGNVVPSPLPTRRTRTFSA